MALRYLTAKLAQQIDEELMGSSSFSLDQLMELAGLACAQALMKVYDRQKHPRVLIGCGPGNQGGDGLVAARHLAMFGYQPTIYLPKPGKKDIYQRLHTQCNNMAIPTINSESDLKANLEKSDVILDAIFGFSFQPPIRAPFDTALQLITASKLPIVSVDVPSGWNVEAGNDGGVGLQPGVLISLTAPKQGVRDYKGRHFLGGRFISKGMEKKYELNLPEYPGYDQIVELPSTGSTKEKL
ncbi:YjeF N-terminal domain-like protein [Ramaria rubella]|nr:YjeF N-terminal domain-like protein [Ramaria rubella]